MMETKLKNAMLEWSDIFMRLSLNDLSRFAHTKGLSLAQMSILMHLHYHAACEVTRFSEMLQISRAAASQMIERLVQQDLVFRFHSKEDRRVRWVDLTENGKNIVTESMDARITWIEILVNQISTDDKKMFSDMLSKLIDYAGKLDEKNVLDREIRE